ncbi:MAG: isocitrate lyase/phosphoenolpyruvate mutase family protein [Pseudomonadota bacterium]
MTQTARAEAFAKLHVPGTPLVLCNIWDAGSAQAVAKTGAKALATGSWSVAAAQGYADGEALPLDFLLRIAERIVATSDLPLSVDFEGAYALAPDGVQENVAALIATGAVGMNFEDRVVQGEGLHSLDVQAGRIAAARAAADAAAGLPFFINARTDLFLGTDPATHAGLVPQALERATAYTDAGASGFFVPGLSEPDLIAQIVEGVSLPVNVLKMGAVGALSELAALGVARVSYGPGPYRNAMKDLSEKAAHLE